MEVAVMSAGPTHRSNQRLLPMEVLVAAISLLLLMEVLKVEVVKVTVKVKAINQ
jgi:hypothetical protein